METETKAYNVIPQVVRMKGTARTLEEGVRDQVARRIAELAEGTALAFGARAEVTYMRGYPVTQNHPENARFAAEVAQAVSGPVDMTVAPLMAGEDFSYMLNARPGAYAFMGNGDTAMIHSPDYDFDDEALPVGASWFAGLIEARMPLR